MEYDKLLPQTVLSKASLKGKEYAWQKNDVEEAVLAAKDQKLATLGGEVQFRVPNGTCELYWLSFDPAPRLASENWQDYVTRSADECIANFNHRCRTTDIVKLGKETFGILRDMSESEDINAYLCFVLYFVTEESHSELSPPSSPSNSRS